MKAPRLGIHLASWLKRLLLPILFAGFAILLVNLFFSNYLAQVSDRFGDSVDQEREVKNLMSELRLAAYAIESSQYGYILSGDEAFTTAHRQALDEFPELIRRLKTLSIDDAEIMQNARSLEEKVNELTLLSLRQMREFKNRERSDAFYFTEGKTVPKIRGEIDRLIQAMTQWQSQQIETATREGRRLAQWSRVVNIVTVMLVFILAAIAVYGVRSYLRRIDEAHDEVKALNANLESQVQARTGEILHANEEIQRFAYIVSHDLRAPLVNIMGFTGELDDIKNKIIEQHRLISERASEHVLPESALAAREDLPEAISFIRASTEKMDRLINAILKMSREGRRALEPAEVDMNLLVEKILNSMAQQIDEADVEIHAEHLPELYTDALAIEQIFTNLIDNAVKYRDPERRSKVAIKGDVNGAFVTYEVTDNGRGVDQADQKRIFELFRRAGLQNTDGEGVGLAFVQAQVRRLLGTITLVSVLGEGSTFKLRFPKTLVVREGSR